MSLSIQQSTDFSPASVQFSKLRKNKNGGKAVYLNAGDNKKLYIQFPFMRSPYGLSAFTDESTDALHTLSTYPSTPTMRRRWLSTTSSRNSTISL
jgi:hypothetical protein